MDDTNLLTAQFEHAHRIGRFFHQGNPASIRGETPIDVGQWPHVYSGYLAQPAPDWVNFGENHLAATNFRQDASARVPGSTVHCRVSLGLKYKFGSPAGDGNPQQLPLPWNSPVSSDEIPQTIRTRPPYAIVLTSCHERFLRLCG